MRAKLFFTFISIFWIILNDTAMAERIDFGAMDEDVAVAVEQSNNTRTVLRFSIDAFYRDAVIIDGQEYYALECGNEALLLNKKEPALPHVCRSIIIPDDARIELKVIASEYVDFLNTPIIPSKGNLKRSVNPEDIPYVFGDVYSRSDWYPSELANLRGPFILRDHRGTVVEINPFRYNPAEKTLRVYTSMTVEIVNVGPGEVNVLQRDNNAKVRIDEFEQIYSRRFLNYYGPAEKYSAVSETGDMLIITYDDFYDAMLPFVEWKRQKGIRTTIVNISSIGEYSYNIKNYIDSVYAANYDLAWVLLVGDAAQIPPGYATGAYSDAYYSKVSGSDDWPDIFIGRFSAETVAQVETQVTRTIAYEKTPGGSDWFHKATGIASNEGPGHFNEYDNQHMEYIRGDLLSYNFTEVDQIYDPTATASQVTTALNNGRSVVNYAGHGSSSSWSTTGFSLTDVNALVNEQMLPFIFSVACFNGNFTSITCFAESWLRATTGTAPTGAIAAYMSIISQAWDPPMYAQDEAADLLIAEEKLTVGGLCYNGSCYMMEATGADGVTEFNAWTIFGDPSVMIRTDDPGTLTVNHDATLLFSQQDLPVEVAGVEGALCALYKDGVLYGSGYTGADGIASIDFYEDLPIGEDLTLTVTAYNSLPYFGTVTIIAPNGSFVIYDDHTIHDSAGNNDGLVNYGESITLDLQLVNVGPDTAFNVAAVLSTSDSFVTITDNIEEYGFIAGDFSTINILDAYAFDIAGNTPDRHEILFILEVSDSAAKDTTWTSDFTIPVYSPELAFVSISMDDITGNNNGNLDPGETAEMVISLINNGSTDAIAVSGIVSEEDALVTITDDNGYFGDINARGGSGDNSSDYYVISADESCPLGHELILHLELTGAGDFSAIVDIDFVVGRRVVIFCDDFSLNQGWTGQGGSGEWQIGPAGGGMSGSGNGDPAEDHSITADNYVLGNDLSPTDGMYDPSLTTTYWIYSPQFDLSAFTGVQIRFSRWLGVEKSDYDHAYFDVYDGSDWVTLFANIGIVDDNSWIDEFYDLSLYADGNQYFQIRFGIGPTDPSVQYCGWNIDDIEIKGYGVIAAGSPRISFLPAALADSLQPDSSTTDTLIVHNIGETLLLARFSSDDEWLAFNTEQQNIDAGDSLILPVTIDMAGQMAGEYCGVIQYSSNDPLNPNGAIPVDIMIHSPNIQFPQSTLSETVPAGLQLTIPFVIDNEGAGRLDYDISRRMFDTRDEAPTGSDAIGFFPPEPGKSDPGEPYYSPVSRNSGGPDIWGHQWIDSDNPDGPVYEWIDITAIGTEIETLGDDNYTPSIPIGFDFPFYESQYSELVITSNGLIMFGGGSIERNNTFLPDELSPNNLIAVWWDDLDLRLVGHVFYYHDAANSRFIVSFISVPNYSSEGGTGALTFQAILYDDGRILLQYKHMDPGIDVSGLAGATIGVEDPSGTDGLTIVYNAAYMHDSLAIRISAANWLSVDPGRGSIDPYMSDTVNVILDAADMYDGDYSGQLTINSNDPDTPEAMIPVLMTIQGEPAPPEIPAPISPANGTTDIAQPFILDWSDAPTATLYRLQIDTGAAFVSTMKDTSITNSQCELSDFAEGTTLYWRVRAENAIGWSDWCPAWNFSTEITWMCGDPDGSKSINILDVTRLINYLYKEGSAPDPLEAGDIDGDGKINILDISYLINYLYKGGPHPDCE